MTKIGISKDSQNMRHAQNSQKNAKILLKSNLKVKCEVLENSNNVTLVEYKNLLKHQCQIVPMKCDNCDKQFEKLDLCLEHLVIEHSNSMLLNCR